MRAPLAEPAERGRLDIHPGVLRKIVERAADGVPGTLRNERSIAGIDVGEYGSSARVTVGTGAPAPVDVRLELTLRYPAAVRAVVDAVRTAVADELARLAGLILGVAGSIGGFGAFLITLVVGIVGLLVGMALDGRLDVTSLIGRGRDR